MINIDVHTDGSCIGNTTGSPGGWGAILVHPLKEKVLRGRDISTTNNRMELTAVIESVRALTKPCAVTVHTDSQYVITTYQAKKRLKNRDLWDQLFEVLHEGQHSISFVHVRGHAGEVYNERCDRIAKEQAGLARKEKLNGVSTFQP